MSTTAEREPVRTVMISLSTNVESATQDRASARTPDPGVDHELTVAKRRRS
jgi:hypothetical protein